MLGLDPTLIGRVLAARSAVFEIVEWPLSTALGSVEALRYDAWGELVASPTAAHPTPWRYRGLLDLSPDGANPLYDMGARFYSPGLGTFTGLDSVTGSAIDPRTMNRFLYALVRVAMRKSPVMATEKSPPLV